jgi:hypothetical protein
MVSRVEFSFTYCSESNWRNDLANNLKYQFLVTAF